jgi:iron(III) transport system ATP-binding protein
MNDSAANADIGIEFRGVTKRYGGSGAALVIHGIDFVVAKGTLTTILGPSGCGKTTALRMIAGLDAPSSGRVLIDGRDVTDAGPAERSVCMVFQSYALFPHLSVLANVAYGLHVSGVAKAVAAPRAREVMASVGLAGFDDRLPSELSGGQQQRVALARALVLEPSVLLFDEPLSNLDTRLLREMREEIRSLQQRLNLTVAYVTHDQGEALAVSDQIIVMNQGRIAQVGSPRDLYESPQSAFVAGFMGEAVLLEGRCDGVGTATLGLLSVRAPATLAAGAVTIAVRPEAWQIGLPGPGTLHARVAKRTYLGNAMEYTIASAVGSVIVTSVDLINPLAPGDELGLTLAAHGVAVFAR